MSSSSSWMWSGFMGCIEAMSGELARKPCHASSLRCQRGSTPPGPGASSGSGTGSWPSQSGMERSRWSAAIRLTRCVVPERGRPITMIGREISTSWISGCCFSSLRMRSRLTA